MTAHRFALPAMDSMPSGSLDSWENLDPILMTCSEATTDNEVNTRVKLLKMVLSVVEMEHHLGKYV